MTEDDFLELVERRCQSMPAELLFSTQKDCNFSADKLSVHPTHYHRHIVGGHKVYYHMQSILLGFLPHPVILVILSIYF